MASSEAWRSPQSSMHSYKNIWDQTERPSQVLLISRYLLLQKIKCFNNNGLEKGYDQ
jgi:hypothetical protein